MRPLPGSRIATRPSGRIARPESGRSFHVGKAIALRHDLAADGSLVLLPTPGHTEGSVCLLSHEERVLLSGDTLFAGARRNTAAISQAAHALPFEAILLAMLVEQAKEIDRLKRLLDEAVS